MASSQEEVPTQKHSSRNRLKKRAPGSQPSFCRLRPTKAARVLKIRAT
ncbi:uncharacterized protein G2W53_007933 [Senna tora]|uniref:Uncharacterized protein n=1 Tax=Senna tora TaxID=362788 RepID=A0A834X6Z9_9FABA|nr:uncharacterized protein G2W53_007933 [Senna tora]